MIDYNSFPLKQNQDVAHYYQQIREVVKNNSETIMIERDADLEIHLRGLGGNSNFYFRVSNPNLNTSSNNTVFYTIESTPKNTVSVGVNKQSTTGESVLKILNGWLGILQGYNNLQIHPEDTIHYQYEDEFEDWFEIVDEDAETNAFDTPRQILISNIITKSVEALKKDGFEAEDEIIQEAEELKDNISKLSKKQAFNGIKTIYAKLKIKGGLAKVKLVYDICEKEVIKMGFHFGTKMLGEKLVNLIDTFVN